MVLMANTSDEKPADWENTYTDVRVDGRTLEAMKILSQWALQTELPPLSVIGASDCVFCWQQDVRKNYAAPDKKRT